MAALTDFAENSILNWLFRNGSATTLPTSWYIALFTAVADGEASSVTEVSGGSYARTAIARNDTTHWKDPSTATQGLVNNVADITFPAATASWGTITHVGVYDASTSGNLFFYGALTASRVVSSGATFKFLATDLQITLG